MECAICFDPIGLAHVTLGCNHTFHLRCISGWFYQQNMNSDLTPEEYTAGETSSSCPCCRARRAYNIAHLDPANATATYAYRARGGAGQHELPRGGVWPVPPPRRPAGP